MPVEKILVMHCFLTTQMIKLFDLQKIRGAKLYFGFLKMVKHIFGNLSLKDNKD